MNTLNFIKRVAKKTGKLVLSEADKKLEISTKAKNDFVTQADKKAEKLIMNEIKNKFPDHAFIAEESHVQGDHIDIFNNSRHIWFIDPIDGTRNFTRDIPLYCISIALFETKAAKTSNNFDYLEGELTHGVVYCPTLDELFYAKKGEGAFLKTKTSEQKLRVSRISKIEQSISATGFPPVNKEENLPYFELMTKKSSAVRRLGSAALDLCYLAAARFDCFWEFDLKPWDIAAGALIVEEAGGKVTDTNGNLLDLFGRDILATNSHLHSKIVEEFGKL